MRFVGDPSTSDARNIHEETRRYIISNIFVRFTEKNEIEEHRQSTDCVRI